MLDTAERLASGLYAAGAQHGDRVAVVCGNHPDVVLLWLAAARAGCVVSVVNALFKAEELAQVFANLEPRMVFADAAHAERSNEALQRSGVPARRFAIGDGGDALQGSALRAGAQAPPMPSGDDLLEVAYTSGTTGRPKGAMFTHAAHLYSLGAWTQRIGLCEDDVFLTVLPLFHAGGMRNSVLAALLGGAQAVVEKEFSASRFWRRVVETGATLFIHVETMSAILMKQPAGELDHHHHVRLAPGSGRPDLIEPFEDRFGIPTLQNYGMTEIGSVTALPAGMPLAEIRRRRNHRRELTYVGDALGAQTRLRVVDAAGVDVAPGTPGELLVQTPGAFSAYLGAPELTRDAFVQGWYRTGDLGVMESSGDVYFVERIREMIRRGGENLAPREVEDVLEKHPDIADAAVFAVPDPVWMEEVKAVVVAVPGRQPSAAEIWSWCDERLADFKVPRYLEFRESIPRTLSGRALKAQLRAEPPVGPATMDRRTLQP